MDAITQSKFKPIEAQPGRDFSDAKISDIKDAKANDSTEKDKANFRDVLLNSNDDVVRSRIAQKNGDQLRMAKTDEEFAQMLAAKANQGNMRKPQNELDKDAFLKLFVTQMRNQDPMNPDNSSQMAAQLAQFHGLEQMMNVNKNLEKMQADDAVGRAVGLINFVGKDIRLDNGKLQLSGGKVVTDAIVNVPTDVSKATMEVRDAGGAEVAAIDLGPLNAGEHKLEWDGATKDGKRVGDGAYTFSLIATDIEGQPVDAKITSTVKVTGVDLHDNGGSFYTALGKVRIGEVAAVGNGGFGVVAAGKGVKPDVAPAEGTAEAAAAAEHAAGVGAVSSAPASAAAGEEPRPAFTPADAAAAKVAVQEAIAAEPTSRLPTGHNAPGAAAIPLPPMPPP